MRSLLIFVAAICSMSRLARAAGPIPFEQWRWQWSSVGITDLGVEDVTAPDEDGTMFSVSSTTIYSSSDSGITWERIFRLPNPSRGLTTEQNQIADASDTRREVDIDDLDQLKRLGIIEAWVTDLNQLDDDIRDLVERAGYKVLESQLRSSTRQADQLALPSGADVITNRIFRLKDSRIILVGGGAGLFVSRDKGKNWQEVILGLNAAEHVVRCLAGDKSLLVAGTDDGFFISTNSGRDWHPVPSMLNRDDRRILAVQDYPDGKGSFLIATSAKLLILSRDESIRELFNVSGRGNDQIIDCRPITKDYLLVAFPNEIRMSHDAGRTWLSESRLGLRSGAIRRIGLYGGEAPSILVYGKEGIFFFNQGQDRWALAINGLRDEFVYGYAAGANGANAWCATATGVFRIGTVAGAAVRSGPAVSQLTLTKPGEPSLLELHQQVLHHSFLDWDELRTWWRRAKSCYWMPQAKISLRYNRNRKNTESLDNNIELTTGQVIVGPDNYSWNNPRADNYTISFSLSWRPDNVLYNTDLPQLGVESRRMDRLRLKLLNQTTLYYQRRLNLRAIMQTREQSGLASQVQSRLELDEIDAQLGALTGEQISENSLDNKNLSPGSAAEPKGGKP